jgi:hypothetical protein
VELRLPGLESWLSNRKKKIPGDILIKKWRMDGWMDGWRRTMIFTWILDGACIALIGTGTNG